MKPVKLRFVSDDGIEATISCDGNHGDRDDYCFVASIAGLMEDKKIYGVDPVQAFSLGLQLIERLTEEKRVGADDDDPMPGTNWRIEIVEEGTGEI